MKSEGTTTFSGKLGEMFRSMGCLLHGMSRAHARWEIETGRVILARRKKLLFIALLPVFGMFAVQAACAAGLPESVPILGGSKAYMAAFVTPKMFYGSILIGLIAGLITGVIGAGGGYILTPALMSFGVKGIMAVGTDQFHLFAKAIMGTTIHRKLGNVNLWLAAWFVAGSVFGVTAGGRINRAIFQYSPALSDAMISTVYVIVLGTLGFYAIGDWLRLRRRAAQSLPADATTRFAHWLQGLPLAPRIEFDRDIVPGGRRISVYPVIVCGAIVGFVAAIMGVGGGFLTFPMFVYGLGVSTFTTVGTDILQIIFTTCYSSIFQYAIYGYVFYSVSIGMLLGSLIGVQVGAMVTKIVKGSVIRAFYALTILAGFANRACALPRKLSDLGYLALSRETSVIIETAGTVIFFVIVGVFAVWILSVFIKNLPAYRRESTGQEDASARPVICNRRKFALGVAGLASFFVALAIGMSPIIEGRTGLQWADMFFNQLAKHSTDYVGEALKKAARFDGKIVDLGVTPRDFADRNEIADIVVRAGLESRVVDDGRVRITGDFGRLARAALADAALAFNNRESDLETVYNVPGCETVYHWWVIFDGLTRRYAQESRNEEANYCKFLTSRVFEPVYNFRGIEPRKVSDNYGRVILLLGFYLLYTIWYGFALLYLFEGLGISVTKGGEKKEA